MRKLYTILIVFAFVQSLFAQDPVIKSELPTIIPPSPNVAALMKFEEVPVSNYTGIPDISIPLFSSGTQSKDINIDLSLKYHPDSAAANERASDIGLGWSLFAGGTISRTVRGMPDEIYSVLSGHEKLGVYQITTGLNSNNYYQMLDLVLDWFQETPVNPIGTNGPAEINEALWNSHIRGISDTEHDLWQFNFMGQSGRFYIEKNLNNQLEVKPLDDYRLKIINNYGDSQNPYIPTSFIIFDDKGFKYTFEDIEETTINTLTDSMSSTTNEESTVPDVIGYSYRSSFYLSRIEDNNGNILVNFNYNTTAMEERTWDTSMTSYHEDRERNSPEWSIRDFFLLNQCGSSANNFTPYPLYSNVSTQKASFTKKIQNIAISGIANINFSYTIGRDDDNFQNAQNCYKLSEIDINDLHTTTVKKIKLTQGYLNTKINRMSLDKVEFATGDNSTIEKYELKYKTVLNPFGDSNFINTDYWGYFNLRSYPEIGGLERDVDPKFCTAETLQKMTLPTGGCMIFDFEPNTYSYIGNSEISNFDGNPNNWDEEHEYTEFEPNPVNHHVLTSSSHLFTIADEQDVRFKATIETLSHDNQLQYFFQINKEACTSQCVQGSVTFEQGDNEKIFSIHLLPGSYEVSFSSPVIGSHDDLIKGGITAYYRNRNSNNLKFLYGGGNRISKIGYFKDGSTNQDYYGGSAAPVDKQKNYEYSLSDGLSSGSLVYNVPNFSYDKHKKECPWCLGVLTTSPGLANSWKDDSTYFWWYNVTTSFNNLNPIKTQGSDVGYKKVKVFETNNGFSTFEYTSPIDFPEDIGVLNLNPPFLPTENFDYKRGLLTDETYSDTQSKPLSYTHYAYEYENHLINTGFRTFYREFEFIDIKANKFYTEYLWRLDHCNQSSTAYPDEPPTCFCYYGLPDEFIDFRLIKEAYGWAKLKTKTKQEYFYLTPSSAANIVQTDETYTYNPINKKIDTSILTNSKGEKMITKYHYSTGDSPDHYNRISEIEKIDYSKDVSSINTPLNTNEIKYSDTFAGNASFLPAVIETAKSTDTPEERVKFNQYDEYGHPLEVQIKNGTLISYIWGYNNSQPIAKIENLAYATIPSATITFIQGKSNADDDHCTGFPCTGHEKELRDALDSLRASFPQAMITTYTYDPLVGVTSITDPKGDIQTFLYDNFGRLQSVTDSKGNILSANEYNYRTQN